MNAALAWAPPKPAICLEFDGLLDRLVAAHGVADLADDAAAADFLDGAGHAVVMFVDDPERVPEAWDLAVILPELLRAWQLPLRAALVRPGRVPRVGQHFGVRRLPALVFLRDGGYLGNLDGLRDWSDYLDEAAGLFAGPARVPPSAVAAARAAAPAAVDGEAS